MCKYFFLIQY
ncbi:unnamed protein product [Acanthoscelides obtectus]|uniref:Uncharacterized protein n=1 Tax=Acanthoscelides obtectus TaxID=200917 RepID=A0A9P0M1R9_ACAOB|nr:unnamed protein product [Acanthoscelides obtectus]CAK1649737.1 hypothetical protein AOBTE_LOCUS16392 [Acanthoscelides obtectus]